MPVITRLGGRKNEPIGDIERNTDGHYQQPNKQQSHRGQSTVTPTKTKDMAGRGQGGTPTPKKSKDWTISQLADFIKSSNENLSQQIADVKSDISAFQTNITEWQTKATERIEKLETSTANNSSAITQQKIVTDRIDRANADINNEFSFWRERADYMEQQMLAIQLVVKKLYHENNQYGRHIKAFNLRIGKLKESISPDQRGDLAGAKPREDTRHLVAEFIIKNDLYPGKNYEQVKDTIEQAYRVGTVEKQGVRNVLVKFSRISHRNTVMRAGKIKEREKELGGSYLMDDLTPEDKSQKNRCHGIMKKLKDEEKKPFFTDGRLKSTTGVIKRKEVLEYNRSQGIEDKRLKEVTVDLLTFRPK